MKNIDEMKKAKSIEQIDIENKRVLIRVDYNVPLTEDYKVSDDKRIYESMKTIQYALSKNAKVILVSHLGRPKGAPSEKYSLKHVIPNVEKHLGQNILFIESLAPEHLQKLNNMQNKQVALIENIRFDAGEEKNDPALAETLSNYCDVFINDAFGTSHRKHASTYALAQKVLASGGSTAAGFLLKSEIDAFDKALGDPKRPLTLIVGGAKISGKLNLLQNVLSLVNNIVIGGAMSFTFLKGQGHAVGKSLVEDELLDEGQKILAAAKKHNVKVYLPQDVICADDIKNPVTIENAQVSNMPQNLMGLDIGEQTIQTYGEVIAQSQTILWNGPMGVFELPQFSHGTFALAKAVADSNGYSVIGGGDTADAVMKSGYEEQVDYISTGGGASLEILEGKVLPAYEVLIN